MYKSLCALLALASAASAQQQLALPFALEYPQPRGGIFNGTDLVRRSFCGGWANATLAVADRPRFPLSGGQVSTSIFQAVGAGLQFTEGEASVYISTGEAPPTTEEFFNRTSAPLGGVRKLDSSGQWCFVTDVAALGIAGVADGTLATIQLLVSVPQTPVNHGSMRFYGSSCADVVLSSTVVAPNLTCEHTSNSAAGGAVKVGGLLGLVGLVALLL